MLIKLTVLVAALLQVIAAGILSIGTFQQSERAFTVFVQPVGWAFSIWGLIYVLSFIYAFYQFLPKNNNQILQQTRIPAAVGFLGSIAWLFFAGQDNWLLWLTVPILAGMAIIFSRVITTSAGGVDSKARLLSRDILFPYAAWTGVAAWINIQALLTEQGFIATETVNVVSNGILLIGILLFTGYYFYRSRFSIWYGGVLVWATFGIVVANVQTEGNIYIGVVAGLYGAAITVVLGYTFFKRLANNVS